MQNYRKVVAQKDAFQVVYRCKKKAPELRGFLIAIN